MRTGTATVATRPPRLGRGALLVLALTAAATLAPAQAEPIVMRFSHVVTPDSPKGKAALRLKQFAEQRTRGRVRVEVYANGSLYGDKEEMDALRRQDVELLAPSLSKLSDRGFGRFELFNLPYIFPGRDLLRWVTHGPIGQELLNGLESGDLVGLAYWDNGFRVTSTNRPLRGPQDLKGLRMRVSAQASEAHMRALGAIPLVMPLSKVYDALRAGAIDGTENTPANLYTQKTHEVQRHITVTNHTYLGYAVVTSARFWNSLPPDIRVRLKLAIVDATRYAVLYAEQENDDALAKMAATGRTEVYHLSIDERHAWRRALRPVHRQSESRIGRETLNAIYRETAALGHRL